MNDYIRKIIGHLAHADDELVAKSRMLEHLQEVYYDALLANTNLTKDRIYELSEMLIAEENAETLAMLETFSKNRLKKGDTSFAKALPTARRVILKDSPKAEKLNQEEQRVSEIIRDLSKLQDAIQDVSEDGSIDDDFREASLLNIFPLFIKEIQNKIINVSNKDSKSAEQFLVDFIKAHLEETQREQSAEIKKFR